MEKGKSDRVIFWGSISRRIKLKKVLLECLRDKMTPNGVRVEAVGTDTDMQYARDPISGKIVRWETCALYDPIRDRTLLKFEGNLVPGANRGVLDHRVSYPIVQKQVATANPIETRTITMLSIIDSTRYHKKLDHSLAAAPSDDVMDLAKRQRLSFPHQISLVWRCPMTLRECTESYANIILKEVLAYNLSPRPSRMNYERIEKIFVHVGKELILKDEDGHETFFTYIWSCTCFGVGSFPVRTMPVRARQRSPPPLTSSSSPSPTPPTTEPPSPFRSPRDKTPETGNRPTRASSLPTIPPDFLEKVRVHITENLQNEDGYSLP